MGQARHLLGIRFIYDEAGDLIGEYDGAGTLIQEIVWLGDIPVATIRTDQGGSGVGVFYIHTDHLNTPRKITRPSDNVVIWRWDSDPFGNGVPNEDPDGNGLSLEFNLAFAGQYRDKETGLVYNMQRYYDPQSGRYYSSDPIGLGGGINTYAYGLSDPIDFTDPFGLQVTGTWIQKPSLSNVKVSPICDANGVCARRPPGLIPGFKAWPPSYLAMIAPFHAEGLVSWEIKCVDDSNCKKDEWTLSGGWKVEANFDVHVRLPLMSNIWTTAYKIGEVGEFLGEATKLAYKYLEPTVKAYQIAIDPTTWCIIMPRH